MIKLKKGLKLQEDAIREIWVRVDTDASEVLDQDELAELGKALGIDLSAQEIEVMLEEMASTSTPSTTTLVAKSSQSSAFTWCHLNALLTSRLATRRGIPGCRAAHHRASLAIWECFDWRAGG